MWSFFLLFDYWHFSHCWVHKYSAQTARMAKNKQINRLKKDTNIVAEQHALIVQYMNIYIVFGSKVLDLS